MQATLLILFATYLDHQIPAANRPGVGIAPWVHEELKSASDLGRDREDLKDFVTKYAAAANAIFGLGAPYFRDADFNARGAANPDFVASKLVAGLDTLPARNANGDWATGDFPAGAVLKYYPNAAFPARDNIDNLGEEEDWFHCRIPKVEEWITTLPAKNPAVVTEGKYIIVAHSAVTRALFDQFVCSRKPDNTAFVAATLVSDGNGAVPYWKDVGFFRTSQTVNDAAAAAGCVGGVNGVCPPTTPAALPSWHKSAKSESQDESDWAPHHLRTVKVVNVPVPHSNPAADLAAITSINKCQTRQTGYACSRQAAARGAAVLAAEGFYVTASVPAYNMFGAIPNMIREDPHKLYDMRRATLVAVHPLGGPPLSNDANWFPMITRGNTAAIPANWCNLPPGPGPRSVKVEYTTRTTKTSGWPFRTVGDPVVTTTTILLAEFTNVLNAADRAQNAAFAIALCQSVGYERSDAQYDGRGRRVPSRLVDLQPEDYFNGDPDDKCDGDCVAYGANGDHKCVNGAGNDVAGTCVNYV